jgi:crossover junction endodeoxyribonuclease RuvC
MRILGIDPGLVACGYGVIDVAAGRPRFVEGGLVRPGRGALPDRLNELFDGISEVIRDLGPAVLALEDLYSKYRHPRTAILMGHARGVICLAAAQGAIETVSYAASEVKRALTGNGRASKLQIHAMVQDRLALKALPRSEHVSDALALALCHWGRSTAARRRVR